MHPLEQIYSAAKAGALQPTTVAGWAFTQYCDLPGNVCLSVLPDIVNTPTYIFAMDEIESPTHLRLILRGIYRKATK